MNLQGHPRPGPEAAALKEAVDDEGPDLLLPSPATHPPLHPQPPLLGTTENYPEMQPSSPCRVSDLGPRLCVSSSCLTPVDRSAAHPRPPAIQSPWSSAKPVGAEGRPHHWPHRDTPMHPLEITGELL